MQCDNPDCFSGHELPAEHYWGNYAVCSDCILQLQECVYEDCPNIPEPPDTACTPCLAYVEIAAARVQAFGGSAFMFTWPVEREGA